MADGQQVECDVAWHMYVKVRKTASDEESSFYNITIYTNIHDQQSVQCTTTSSLGSEAQPKHNSRRVRRQQNNNTATVETGMFGARCYAEVHSSSEQSK